MDGYGTILSRLNSNAGERSESSFTSSYVSIKDTKGKGNYESCFQGIEDEGDMITIHNMSTVDISKFFRKQSSDI